MFLGAVILFDVCRALVFALIRAFGLPVYMSYAIDWERALFGDPLPIHRFQAWMGAGGPLGAFDRLMGVAYASHFLAFLLFGLTLWMLRPRAFGRFKAAMLATVYLGLVGYLLVPTVPPWMANETFFVLPPMAGVAGQLFTAHLPALTAAFAINPVAAMPSLHCAFPTMLALFATRCFGRALGAAMWCYAALVWASSVCLGQHYLVDVMAGVALSIVVFGVVHGVPAMRRGLERFGDRAGALPLSTHALASGLLLALTQAVGFAAAEIAAASPELPTPAFVERELAGWSPMASYYRGLHAHEQGHYAEAIGLLERAAEEAPAAWVKTAARDLQARSAFYQHDWPVVLSSAAQVGQLRPGLALMVAEALVRSGQPEQGLRAARPHPGPVHRHRGSERAARPARARHRPDPEALPAGLSPARIDPRAPG